MQSITEDAAIEMDGEIVNLNKGDKITIIPAVADHILLEDTPITLNGEIYLLEFGDSISVDPKGSYFVSNAVEIDTLDGRFLLEEGDRIVIKEASKYAKAAALAMRMKHMIANVVRAIARRWKVVGDEKEVFAKIADSQSWHNLLEILDVEDVGDMEAVIAGNATTPAEDIETIAKALESAGEKDLAAYIRQKIPTTKLNKITSWIGKLVHGEKPKKLEQAKARYEPPKSQSEQEARKIVKVDSNFVHKMRDLVGQLGGPENFIQYLKQII